MAEVRCPIQKASINFIFSILRQNIGVLGQMRADISSPVAVTLHLGHISSLLLSFCHQLHNEGADVCLGRDVFRRIIIVMLMSWLTS